MSLDGHARWMARAIALAERGRATCRPNPMVGCVLIRDGDLIGQGWHERPGGPHAEIAALNDAGDARGATAYVTLEPCNHHGRTGPCSVALRDAGIDEVVYAAADSSAAAAGGADLLRDAGVRVVAGVLESWAAEQNVVFFHGIDDQRPHVTLKLAHTRGGALVGAERWLTGPAARAAVHRLRRFVDGVLVGSGTVLADDPRLDVRHVELDGPGPRPIVLDSRGRIPPTSRVVRPGALVVTGDRSDPQWRQALVDAGAGVIVVEAHAAGLDLMQAMHELWSRGIHAILAEPGATLAASLLAAGHVDRLISHVADTTISDRYVLPAAVSAAADWRLRRVVPRAGDLEVERRPA